MGSFSFEKSVIKTHIFCMGKENIVFMIEKGKLIYVTIALDMALLHSFMISWYTADIEQSFVC